MSIDVCTEPEALLIREFFKILEVLLLLRRFFGNSRISASLSPPDVL
jgi:hypothetical protein